MLSSDREYNEQSMTDKQIKNFLPGPTMVLPEVLDKLALPVIGHHSVGFKRLMEQVNPRLQRLFGTRHAVFTLTCTASTALEAALLNAAGKKTLILTNGGFGDRWFEASRSLGLEADCFNPGWGVPFADHEIRRVLDWGRYDTLVVVHGETSTGMINLLEPIITVLASRPEVIFVVDAVATLGGVPLEMDAVGIDIMVGASQKCLALPPGIAPVGVSEKALERSRSSKRKGYALDFNLWRERWEQHQTVATPALPQLRALNYQLEKIESETLNARWDRHLRMSQMTLNWAAEHRWLSFSPEGFRLPTVSCLRPQSGRKTTPIVEALLERGYLIDDGYGKLKGRTLRIGHLGDWKESDLKELQAALSDVLQK